MLVYNGLEQFTLYNSINSVAVLNKVTTVTMTVTKGNSYCNNWLKFSGHDFPVLGLVIQDCRSWSFCTVAVIHICE